MSLHLTALEAKMIVSLSRNYFRNEEDLTAPIWSNCLDESSVVVDAVSRPGVVGSLSKKNLVKAYGAGRDAVVALTEAGVAAIETAKAIYAAHK